MLFFDKKILPEKNLTTWGPLYTCLVMRHTKGGSNTSFTQVFHTNYAQILPDIYDKVKFTQSRWMPARKKLNIFIQVLFLCFRISPTAPSCFPFGALILYNQQHALLQFNSLFLLGGQVTGLHLILQLAEICMQINGIFHLFTEEV